MTSKVFPALLLLGFLIVVVTSFQSSALQSIGVNILPARQIHALLLKDSATNTNFKKYWMVFLKKGPNRNHSKVDVAKIQAAHMDHINYLADIGKLAVAGPFSDNGDLRAIYIMDSADSLGVAEMMKTDTAIITGRLTFEIRPWWTEKNCLFQ